MDDPLWTPEREWEGQDAFLIGGGPSLTGFKFQSLAGKNVIGCNDAFHLGPGIISICAFGDAAWWQKNKFKLEKFPNRIVTSAPSMLPFKVPNMLKMERERDGIHSGNKIGWNYSTGAMAINLAISLGAKRIFLLGYDVSSQGHTHHWHNHNPKPIHGDSFARFMEGFHTLKAAIPAGVEVFNVTDGISKLTCFPTISFAMFQSVLDEQEVLSS